MARSTLLVAVGAVLGGIAVLLTALAAAFEPLLVFLAVPFGAAGYLIWYQGTGRLAARARREARAGRTAERGRRRGRPPGEDGTRSDGAGPRWADSEAADRRARARRRAAEASAGVRSDSGTKGTSFGRDRGRSSRERRRPPDNERAMTDREARSVLGVDRDSDEEAVRTAYRERVKETHPDTDGGDEEAFKRVTAAYERLDGRH